MDVNMAETIAATATSMQTFQTMTGAAFMAMGAAEVAALSREELVRLTFRGRAIAGAIATYIEATKSRKRTTRSTVAAFDIQAEADVLKMKPQDIAELSKEGLEKLVLQSQEVMERCPFKPGCRSAIFVENMHVTLELLLDDIFLSSASIPL
jgi:hypothetical protein